VLFYFILFYFSLFLPCFQFLPCVYTIHSPPLNISSRQHSPWHPYQQHTVMAFIISVTHHPSPWTSTCLHYTYLNRTPILTPYGACHNQPYWLSTHTYFSLTTPILRLIYLVWLLCLDCVTLKMDDSMILWNVWNCLPSSAVNLQHISCENIRSHNMQDVVKCKFSFV